MNTNTLTLATALLLTGCAMTPVQKQWATVGASVVIVGAIAAHRADRGETGASKTSMSCTNYQLCAGVPRGK